MFSKLLTLVTILAFSLQIHATPVYAHVQTIEARKFSFKNFLDTAAQDVEKVAHVASSVAKVAVPLVKVAKAAAPLVKVAESAAPLVKAAEAAAPLVADTAKREPFDDEDRELVARTWKDTLRQALNEFTKEEQAKEAAAVPATS